TINGGTVSATGGNGRAVYNNDIGSVTISGGTISSTGGDAVYNIGLATITGGTISATSNYAVNNVVQMAIIGGVDTVYYTGSATISGGLVFAQRESAIFGTYDASSGNPVIIGWNKPTETPVYNASSNTALTVSPSPATAVWQSKDGKAGIEYANGANTGFIEIDGVSVEDGTDPIRTPQLASNNIHAYAMGNSIVLQNLPSNAKVEVFGLNGKLITTSHSPLATSQSVSVHAKGIYIIKVTSRGVSLMPNVLRVAVR
ncbi:MAG: T9SS type A sorting domain-containing protein, partial [Fibromonadaceae bacterium]|nr:T9SS type A sorting domain-containing protein [Fibromonadaceae bacterium]